MSRASRETTWWRATSSRRTVLPWRKAKWVSARKTLGQFIEKRFEPWAKATFEKASPKTWLDWYRVGLRAIQGYKRLADMQLPPTLRFPLCPRLKCVPFCTEALFPSVYDVHAVAMSGKYCWNPVHSCGKDAAESVWSFEGTGTEQLNQQIRMETEVNHHGRTTEKRITAALRRPRIY